MQISNIILIPGYKMTSQYMTNLGNFLEKNGFKIHTIPEIEPNIYKISYCVEKIKNYILKNNLKNIFLIGHSKGGIIARYLLAETDLKSKIKKIITISSPHRGSILAIYSLHNAHELTPWSKTIRSLNKQEVNSKNHINIYGIKDRIVIPNKSLHLPGAKNIKTNIKGHSKPLTSPEVWEIILANCNLNNKTTLSQEYLGMK